MYFQIHVKDLDLTDAVQALVREKLGLLNHLLQDYPSDSVMAAVRLIRLPVTDLFYNVRVVLELPGDRFFASANAETLESGLVNVAAELERQVQHLLSDKRNETHWKRLSHPSETVRRTVPVDVDELLDIQEEVRSRTEQQAHREGPAEKAA
ncbi:MAG: HPF/RaiA family ribosome-associated protein [Sphingomonadaceae bacterium]